MARYFYHYYAQTYLAGSQSTIRNKTQQIDMKKFPGLYASHADAIADLKNACRWMLGNGNFLFSLTNGQTNTATYTDSYGNVIELTRDGLMMLNPDADGIPQGARLYRVNNENDNGELDLSIACWA
jgi:hypothetical protein